MQLIKLQQRIFENEPFQFIKNNNRILMNDGYDGLFFINQHLLIQSYMPAPSSMCTYTEFLNCNGTKLFMSDPDEGTFKIIYFLENLVTDGYDKEYHTFSPYYHHWQDELILVTNRDYFFSIANHNNTLVAIDETYVKETYPDFYAFWHKYHTYMYRHQVNSCTKTIIYENPETNTVTFDDHTHNIQIKTTKPVGADFYKIIYQKNVFAFISEYLIVVKHQENEYQLYPDGTLYRFYLACFIQEDNTLFLMILLHHEASKKGKVIKYQLSFE